MKPGVSNPSTPSVKLNLDRFLKVDDSSKDHWASRFHQLLTSGPVVPSFSAAAIQLSVLSQNEATAIKEFASVISLDPGLASRCIQVAGSTRHVAHAIDNLDQALLIIGCKEIRRIALTVAAMGAFSGYRGKINWRRFWLHNILVARLTEKIASAFRKTTGLEYLGGLLHDVGKAIVEHYFPFEFKQIVTGAIERNCSHARMERITFGLDHTQIGAATGALMHLHPHIIHGIWFHHDPLNDAHAANPEGDGGFLAACISLGDRFAHQLCSRQKIPGEGTLRIQDSLEWDFLLRFSATASLKWNLDVELKQTQEDLRSFM
jgi:HD-like signal output (HDOD) protein